MFQVPLLKIYIKETRATVFTDGFQQRSFQIFGSIAKQRQIKLSVNYFLVFEVRIKQGEDIKSYEH